MSIIRRIRQEYLNEDGVATISLKVYFLGILIYEDVFDSTSNAVLSQFIEFDIKQPPNGLYDVNKIGFKQEEEQNE